jgi:type IV pilus assembly protein PilE
MTRSQRGVTLIELMVVMMIIGVLAAIAYPSYRQQIRRSNRTEARVALEQTASALEKCYTRYMAYNDIANCPAADQFDGGGAFLTPRGFYQVTAAIPNATQYTLTATPQGQQAQDAECMNFTLNQTGTRGVSGTASTQPARCW